MATTEQYVYLYIIGSQSGPVKVGISHDPTAGAAQLRSKRNEKLILMGQYPAGRVRALAAERYVHWLLRDKAIGGEWFNVTRTEAAQAIHDAVATAIEAELSRPPRPEARSQPRRTSLR
jgi:hypothetical protein